jgi:hypothetical protein
MKRYDRQSCGGHGCSQDGMPECHYGTYVMYDDIEALLLVCHAITTNPSNRPSADLIKRLKKAYFILQGEFNHPVNKSIS